MENPTSKKCVPCEGGIAPMTKDEANTYMAQVIGWTIAGDAKSIARHFEFKDFKEAMTFVNKIADLAESEGHHPDISISYSKVDLTLSTHAIGGLSQNDFILAAKINQF